ncbi:GNAT family N-acetyltransferase [Streptomyces sp. NPDC001739]
MVTPRPLSPDDAKALTRIYSGASVRHTTGTQLTLARAQQMVQTALARAAEIPRTQWNWAIVDTDEMIALIALRRRTPSMGTLSYILREDTWGNGYALSLVRMGKPDPYASEGASAS